MMWLTLYLFAGQSFKVKSNYFFQPKELDLLSRQSKKMIKHNYKNRIAILIS